MDYELGHCPCERPLSALSIEPDIRPCDVANNMRLDKGTLNETLLLINSRL